MNGGPSLVGIGASHDDAGPLAAQAMAGETAQLYWEELPEPVSRWRRIAAWALGALSLVWIVGAIALAWRDLGYMAPLGLIQFVAELAIVPLVAMVAWLLLLRTSHAEAQRFGATARGMRAEAFALEHMVASLGSTIESHRAQLTEQMQMLSSTGDAATAQLGDIGHRMSEEIKQANSHAMLLADASRTAQDKLGALLATLPRAEAETAALADTIERTGLAAGERTASLDAQVAALAARGREAEVIAGGAAEKLAAHLQRMDATGQSAGARLEQVTSDAAAAVDALLDRTSAAIAESRSGLSAQGDAMLALVGASQAALDHAARESAEALSERISLIEMVIERIAGRLDAQRGASAALFDELAGGIGGAEQRMDSLHERGVRQSQALAAAVSALAQSTDAVTVALQTNDATATHAISTTETLLTALDAAAREIDETLPEAFDRLDARVLASKKVVSAAKPELLALVTAAESTHDAIEAVAQVVADQRRTVETLNQTLQEALATGTDKADAIEQMLVAASSRAVQLSEDAAPRLLEALLRVRDTAAAAADHAREALARVIPEAAESLGKASTQALSRAVDVRVEEHVARISSVTEGAVDAAQRATLRLEQRLSAIEDAAAQVDARLAEDREEREKNEHEGFARRASLLIEQLNSVSIDLTRTFAPEVSDSAWSAYLKGDRGVFTRRAVRLLDGSEQRDIARLYDDSTPFREQVNRYIHDFEAMLRNVLAQRDASPLGVTLLSSDMGKLYVALAQAIERLR